jgi:hypothetical protein
LVHQQAILQAQATQWFRWLMPSLFELSFARDVLPVLLRAIRPGLAIALAQRKRWQVLLQKRK